MSGRSSMSVDAQGKEGTGPSRRRTSVNSTARVVMWTTKTRNGKHDEIELGRDTLFYEVLS